MTVTNLNQARKTRQRAEEKRQADENAVKYGQTKAERVLNAAKTDMTAKRLDQMKFEDE